MGRWNLDTRHKRLLVGGASALVMVLLLLLYTSSVRNEAEKTREDALARYGGEQVEVCVATRDLAVGEQVDLENTELRLWLSDLLPEGTILDREKIVGMTVAESIRKGEPLVQSRLGEEAEGITVPSGLCAVSMPAQAVQAVGGALGAGSLVDVYATGASGVSLLGERILVLETSSSALDSSKSGGSSSASTRGRSELAWVTVAVEPSMVQEFIAASQSSTLYLTLPGSEAPASEDDVSSLEEGPKTAQGAWKGAGEDE